MGEVGARCLDTDNGKSEFYLLRVRVLVSVMNDLS